MIVGKNRNAEGTHFDGRLRLPGKIKQCSRQVDLVFLLPVRYCMDSSNEADGIADKKIFFCFLCGMKAPFESYGRSLGHPSGSSHKSKIM